MILVVVSSSFRDVVVSSVAFFFCPSVFPGLRALWHPRCVVLNCLLLLFGLGLLLSAVPGLYGVACVSPFFAAFKTIKVALNLVIISRSRRRCRLEPSLLSSHLLLGPVVVHQKVRLIEEGVPV
jgi:hypothetical protein